MTESDRIYHQMRRQALEVGETNVQARRESSPQVQPDPIAESQARVQRWRMLRQTDPKSVESAEAELKARIAAQMAN